MKKTPSDEGTQQARDFLRLVREPQTGPRAPSADKPPLIELPDFTLTRQVLNARGRTDLLKDIGGFQTQRRYLHLSLPLMLLFVGAGAVPLLTELPNSALVSVGIMAIMGTVVGLLLFPKVFGETYVLRVRTLQGDREVFRSQDAELFTRVVDALDRALVWREPKPLRALVR
ncbi:DUF6232 family protein [Stigmatella sp. ncwal1]|uniref:DUF6232 family protein n=1 Tax=Stigmatella ashevillensis TaxID=2995309 RepID=A0ABT5DG55_9BACT|nr:DUF6232 family protein [Stigmatella ashevillena]MDC0712059.1 DUF6232 family protein [Stigmatella ashevillena]